MCHHGRGTEGEAKRGYGKSLLSLHAAVMLFGLSAVLGQAVDVPAAALAGGRVICSSILLFLLCRIRRIPLAPDTWKDRGIAAWAGVVLAFHWTAFFQSVQNSSVAVGTITFSSFPLFLTVLEPLVFRERIRGRSIFSALLLLVGVMITIPEFSMDNRITAGIAWGMASAFAYGIMTLANRHLSSCCSAETVCLYEQGTAAVVLLPFLLSGEVRWTGQSVAGVAALGIFCTAFAHSLYVSAQKRVKAQTAGIISGMETVYGILYAFLFLGEIPGTREIIGGTVILGTVLISSVVLSQKKEELIKK